MPEVGFEVKNQLFPAGVVRIRKRPTSQVNSFLAYNWARIYPSKDSPEDLAYTVGLDAEAGFVVKIDTVQAGPALKGRYEVLRGPFSNQSPIVAILPTTDGLSRSFAELVQWSVKAIQGFKFRYDEVVEKLKLDEPQDDEALLKHFDGKAAFKEFRATWSPEYKATFCRLARAVHAAGLDWWHMSKDVQVRFGRKHSGSERAVSVLGVIRGTRTRTLSWVREVGGMSKVNRLPMADDLITKVEATLAAERDTVAEMFPSESERPGLWPDQLLEDPIEPGDSDEDDVRERPEPETTTYTIDDILQEGCFLDRAELERLLDRLRAKKNLILQGPPGTGKTWLAKRLGFALIGRKDDSKLRAVQFHPNLSYEDFVRGWRPTGEGKLSLADGIFMEAINAATDHPESAYVIVIEEINRGNPAQIFGELLTLLEASKRKPSEALELCYPDADGSRRPVHIPANLHVIGTMNIADRSLALVDLALRRRFAFVGLEPKLGGAWRDWVVKECGIDPAVVDDIEKRMTSLNDVIAADPRLGKQFRVGHSYVTPNHRLEAGETNEWFRQVVDTEIGPLLEEYWFDAPSEAQKARERLVQGW